jgi:hypothetical protein
VQCNKIKKVDEYYASSRGRQSLEESLVLLSSVKLFLLCIHESLSKRSRPR